LTLQFHSNHKLLLLQAHNHFPHVIACESSL